MPMDHNENSPPSVLGPCQYQSALQLGPWKKASVSALVIVLCDHTDWQDFSLLTDPLAHHGHHFSHTAHALCHLHTLITNSILYEVEQAAKPVESLSKE
jgi:hypothetical protein